MFLLTDLFVALNYFSLLSKSISRTFSLVKCIRFLFFISDVRMRGGRVHHCLAPLHPHHCYGGTLALAVCHHLLRSATPQVITF